MDIFALELVYCYINNNGDDVLATAVNLHQQYVGFNLHVQCT